MCNLFFLSTKTFFVKRRKPKECSKSREKAYHEKGVKTTISRIKVKKVTLKGCAAG